MTDGTKLTVFFDGSCPLCQKEIGFYRGLNHAEAVAFVDISRTVDAVITPGLLKADAMRRFHVMHPDGRISSGGPAFAHLWSRLPRLRWIGRVLLRKPFPCLLDGAYTLFLPMRPVLQRLLGGRIKQPLPSEAE